MSEQEFQEAFDKFFAKFWIYNYEVTYFDSVYNNCSEINSGFVIATSMDDAYQRLKSYYLEPGEDFEKIVIETREYEVGEFTSKFIIPFAKNESLLQIEKSGN